MFWVLVCIVFYFLIWYDSLCYYGKRMFWFNLLLVYRVLVLLNSLPFLVVLMMISSIYLFYFLSSSAIYPYFDFSTNLTHVVDFSGSIVSSWCDCLLFSPLSFDSTSLIYILPPVVPPPHSSGPLPIDSPSPLGLPPSHPPRAPDLLDNLYLSGSEDNDGSTAVVPLSSSPPPPYHSLPHEILARAHSLSSASVPAVVSPAVPPVGPPVPAVPPAGPLVPAVPPVEPPVPAVPPAGPLVPATRAADLISLQHPASFSSPVPPWDPLFGELFYGWPPAEPVVSVVLPEEPSANVLYYPELSALVPYGPEPLANVPYGPVPMGWSNTGRNFILEALSHNYIWFSAPINLLPSELQPNPWVTHVVDQSVRESLIAAYMSNYGGRSFVIRRIIPEWWDPNTLGYPEISEFEYMYLHYYVFNLPDPLRPPLYLSYPFLYDLGYDYIRGTQPASPYPLPVPHGPPHRGFPLDILPLEVFRPFYTVNFFSDMPVSPLPPASLSTPTYTSDPSAIVPYFTPLPSQAGSFTAPSTYARIPIAYSPTSIPIVSQPILDSDIHSYIYWMYPRLYDSVGSRRIYWDPNTLELFLLPPYYGRNITTWSVDYTGALQNLSAFNQSSYFINPLLFSVALNGGPSLASYFPNMQISSDFINNAFLSPESALTLSPLTRSHHLQAYAHGLGLIPTLNFYNWCEENIYVNGILCLDNVTNDPSTLGSILFPYIEHLPKYQSEFRSFFFTFFGPGPANQVPPLDFSVDFFSRISNNCRSSSLYPFPPR